MAAIGPVTHFKHVGHRCEIEFSIEMRKYVPAARGFPAQTVPELIGINGDEEEAGLTMEVLACGFSHLAGRGEMDEAVAQVGGAAAIDPESLGLAPGGGRTDFVDGRHACPFGPL